MTEKRIIYADKVRSLCIKDNLYTSGTNEQYAHLLTDLCDVEEATLDAILNIARDILAHSNVERLTKCYGCTATELFQNIATNLINECTYTFIKF